MKRLSALLGAAGLAAVVLALMSPPAMAGRVGGPMSVAGTAPAGLSVYYDISFAADEQAIITLNGNGRSTMFVLVYDSDGHVVTGSGSGDRRTATINVYRAGVFRVEVRNLGVLDNTFTLKTN